MEVRVKERFKKKLVRCRLKWAVQRVSFGKRIKRADATKVEETGGEEVRKSIRRTALRET